MVASYITFLFVNSYLFSRSAYLKQMQFQQPFQIFNSSLIVLFMFVTIYQDIFSLFQLILLDLQYFFVLENSILIFFHYNYPILFFFSFLPPIDSLELHFHLMSLFCTFGFYYIPILQISINILILLNLSIAKA